jgi:hypothetical protein
MGDALAMVFPDHPSLADRPGGRLMPQLGPEASVLMIVSNRNPTQTVRQMEGQKTSD